MGQACGARVQDYKNADGGKEGLVLGIKDVADMLDFDEQQARNMVYVLFFLPSCAWIKGKLRSAHYHACVVPF